MTKSADPKKRVAPQDDKNEDEEGEEKGAPAEEESDDEDEVVAVVEDNIMVPFMQSFIFSLIWSLGGYLEDTERAKLECFLKANTDLELPTLPAGDSLYDYNVNPSTGRQHSPHLSPRSVQC